MKMSITAEKLKQVMRNWTSGVAIVSSQFRGISHGMTVNSFTSVSVEPPLVVVTLANQTRTCDLVKKSHEFGVTILSSQQKGISDRFAGIMGDNEDRFAYLETYSLISPSLLISGGLAWLDCSVINEINLGKSTLFIADVVAAEAEQGDPLLYHDRDYFRLGERNG
jgi:flavin reductase (DIM6/NTAB) family NADH-FMN oxidoreductase RutF